MAIRYELHKKDLDYFEAWLQADGWELQPPKGEYEVLRATKVGKKKPLIIYKTNKANHEHLSFADEFIGIIKQFIKQKDMPLDCRGCEHFSLKTTKCKLNNIKATEIDTSIHACKALDDILKDHNADMNALHFGDDFL